MKFKFILASVFLFISFSLITLIYSNNIVKTSYCINNDALDNIAPTIQLISPAKCEEYIISKPTIKISYFDKSNIDLSCVKLFVNYKDVTKDSTITNSEISYTPSEKFKRGTQIVKLEISDLSSNKNKTSMEWYFTVGTPIYKHFRGLLHSHTSASDGNGSYDDAYYLSRDKANLDFFFITEHSNMLDNNLNCNINDASKSTEWTNLAKSSKKFSSSKDFLALYGFEMTYPYDIKNQIGHINIFNSKGFVSYEKDNLNLDDFYKFLYNQDNLIGQFNHPCEKFGTFNNFKYCKYGDSVISLLEVRNGYDSDNSKNISSYDMYQLALDNGWHVAPTCNQDNHRVNFGIANELRTIALCSELNKDSLYDALKNMRVYCSEDKNMQIDYTINNLPMGSTLTKCSKLNFCISAIDKDNSDKIKEIQVVSNNHNIIKSNKYNSNIAKLDFSIKSEKNTFYYIKVIQENNKISVTAPIWIQ